MAAHLDPPPRARTVLVTDASQPIGRATALRLADSGDWVLACAPDRASMRDLARETAAGGLIETWPLDLGDETSCRGALAHADAIFGRLDAVVHAAITAHFSAVEETDSDTLEAVFASNFFGAHRLLKLAIPAFRARRRGHLICVTSVAGRVALPLSALLSASHHALEGLLDALRLELRGFGIDVSMIEPGVVRRGVVADTAGRVERAIATMAPDSPYGQVARALAEALEDVSADAASPQDVADVVAKALSAKAPKARYPVTRRTAAWLWARRLLPTRVLDRRIAKALGLPDDE
ncbi:MAG: hypothetical protein CSA66_07190 [Proteobacteria bacterium]|nr:MAG: hypothetical protein CSA66_07190 [Pseudomonadota bacterium]